MVSLQRRAAGFAACLVLLALTMMAITPAAAQPQPAILNPSQAKAAADYLVDQLVDGNHLNSSYTGQPDVGATSDALLGIVASGVHVSDAQAISAWLEAQAASYATQSAGASGKLILVATSMANQPTSWGGVDLVKLTTDSLTSDPTAGSSSFSAALAILGLRTAGAEVPGTAVTALLAAQDSTGAFGYQNDGAFTADVDTTALVIQALARLPQSSATTAALTSALSWLQSQLSQDHWASYSPANTAGLAIPALMVAGVDASAATAWLLGRQLSDGGFAATADGTTSDAYATAQAILGITGTALGSVVVVVDPSPTAVPTSTPAGTPTSTGTPAATGSTPARPSVSDSSGPTGTGSASVTSAPLTPRLPDTGDGIGGLAVLLGMVIVALAAARVALRRR